MDMDLERGKIGSIDAAPYIFFREVATISFAIAYGAAQRLCRVGSLTSFVQSTLPLSQIGIERQITSGYENAEGAMKFASFFLSSSRCAQRCGMNEQGTALRPTLWSCDWTDEMTGLLRNLFIHPAQ